jgi:uncharacterized protein (TIGR02246 family)
MGVLPDQRGAGVGDARDMTIPRTSTTEGPADDGSDHDEIRALFDRACQAWSVGDAEAYGACFTDDCDYVSFDGHWERSRRAMVAAHDELFRGVLFGSRLIGEVDAIRPLHPDVALVHAHGSVLVAWRRHLPRRRSTRNTLVAVRGTQGWRIAAAHNGRIRPVGIPAADSIPARVAHLLDALSRTVGIGRYSSDPEPRS